MSPLDAGLLYIFFKEMRKLMSMINLFLLILAGGLTG